MEHWSKEELKAAVIAYKEMQDAFSKGKPIVKSDVYKTLSARYGRTAKSYEYRMQNISYVLSISGRDWLEGLKPARNVGTNVIAEIEGILSEIEGRGVNENIFVNAAVSSGRQKKSQDIPAAIVNPGKQTTTTTVHKRDQNIVVWVLNNSGGKCESCTLAAPFTGNDGLPYLEVHHVKQLADGGSDSTSNAVALCPNCHREMHYGVNAKEKRQLLYKAVARLKPE